MEKELPKEVILNLDKLDSSYWASHPAKIAYKHGLTDGAIVAHSHHQLQLNAVVDHAAEIAKENDRLTGLFERFYKDTVIHISIHEDEKSYKQASDTAEEGWVNFKIKHGINTAVNIDTQNIDIKE